MSKSLLIIDANVKFQNVVSKTPHRGRYDNGYNQDGYVSFEYYYSLDTSFAQQLVNLELLYSSNTEDDTVVKQLLAHNAKPVDGVSDGRANLVSRDVESVGQKQKMHSMIDDSEYEKVFRIVAPLPLCSIKQMYVNVETGELVDKKQFRREVINGDGTVELHTADDSMSVLAKSDTFVRIWASSYQLNASTLAPSDINSITEKMSDVITQDDADHYEQPPFESLLKFLSWRTKFHNKRYETRDVYYVMDWTPKEDGVTHEGIIPTKQSCISYKEAVSTVQQWRREIIREKEILFNRRYVQVTEHHVVPNERYEVRVEVMPGAPMKYAHVQIMGHDIIVYKGQPFVLYAAVAEVEKRPNAFMRTESRIMKDASVMRMFNESFWRY